MVQRTAPRRHRHSIRCLASLVISIQSRYHARVIVSRNVSGARVAVPDSSVLSREKLTSARKCAECARDEMAGSLGQSATYESANRSLFEMSRRPRTCASRQHHGRTPRATVEEEKYLVTVPT
ncbi:uncharacterized protein LOC116845942 [Odontomachus brunneus]|uniref:uncharacterized protein LOC116845942 n=1 Tax=Odontomachus brunneus TaxID=486640 RepID=UPI0013F200FD|nr:uncharacterized protein LOC116845942 [Odontomachus brunneus]